VSRLTLSFSEAFDSPAIKRKGITLDFLEIGNEGDLYVFVPLPYAVKSLTNMADPHSNNHLRNSSYSSATWVAEWEAFGTNITESFDLAGRGIKWLGGSFAGSSHATTGFSPQSIISKGILDSVPGKLMTTYVPCLHLGRCLAE
jgi:hypothetical protein